VNATVATLGCRMPPHRSLDDRLFDLERELETEKRERKELENSVKPILDFYSAGTLIGKLLWIIGGIVTGSAAVWAVISGWVTNHPK
jgi:hypothetical protein